MHQVTQEASLNFNEGIVSVKGIPTHVVTFGCWLSDKDAVATANCVILLLPGNPGIIQFYKEFMSKIYEGLNGQVPVWGISHAGHVKLPDNVKSPLLSGNEDLYGLDGQIEHKIAFIEQFVPRDQSLVLIGHSIGCYITLKIMNSFVGAQVLKSILLFPTIEKLAQTPHGRWAKPLLAFCQPIAMFFLHILSYLSERMQYKIMQWYFQGEAISDCVLRASLNVFDPRCSKKWMFLAYQEMVLVEDLNVNDVARHIDDLIFYYGSCDEWCPQSFYYEMKNRFPLSNIILCERGFQHAFVLKSSREVGELVVGWIKDMYKQCCLD